jgi:hypothetical protein
MSEQHELESMVGAGMTPMQVIVAATSRPAEYMKLTKMGTLAAGKEADFLVLDANPLDDITNTQRISKIHEGRGSGRAAAGPQQAVHQLTSRRHLMKVRLLSCLIVAGLLTTSAAAQQLTGTMSGTVKDTQGAVVPGVTVTAASDALIGGPRTTVTNETGSYQFQTLPTNVSVTSSSRASSRGNVKGSASRWRRTHAWTRLQVGSLQRASVTGASPVVMR